MEYITALGYTDAAVAVTAGAYSANDVVGGGLRFPAAARHPQTKLKSVMVADAAAQSVNYFLVLFSSIPTNIADNGTFDIADADLKNVVVIVSLPTTDRTAFTDNSVTLTSTVLAANGGMGIPLASKEGDGDLWGFLYTTGTPTYVATTDVVIVIGVGT